MNEHSNNPLVSIIVITYNSSKYVLETLESAREQTYQNIELIVSDDCSTDNTVDLCQKWLNENKERFVRTIIITTKKNYGIPANCNRGVNAASGEWVKYIAGDDMLIKTCIEDYITYSKSNPSAKIIAGGIITTGSSVRRKIFLPDQWQRLDAKQQLRWQIRNGSIVQGSSTIIERETLRFLNGFNEKYRLMEDFPFYVKATQNNFKLHTLKKPVVLYRTHVNSVLQKKESTFSMMYYQYTKDVIFPLAFQEKLYFFYWHKKIAYFLSDRKKQCPYNKQIFRYIVVAVLDPYSYYIKIKRLFKKT